MISAPNIWTFSLCYILMNSSSACFCSRCRTGSWPRTSARWHRTPWKGRPRELFPPLPPRLQSSSAPTSEFPWLEAGSSRSALRSMCKDKQERREQVGKAEEQSATRQCFAAPRLQKPEQDAPCPARCCWAPFCHGTGGCRGCCPCCCPRRVPCQRYCW